MFLCAIINTYFSLKVTDNIPTKWMWSASANEENHLPKLQTPHIVWSSLLYPLSNAGRINMFSKTVEVYETECEKCLPKHLNSDGSCLHKRGCFCSALEASHILITLSGLQSASLFRL